MPLSSIVGNIGTMNETVFPTVMTNQIDVDDSIAILEDDRSLFAPWFMKLCPAKKAAKGMKCEWIEDEVVPVYTTSATTIGAGVTALVVTAGTGNWIKPNDMLYVETTGERLLATAVATDIVTVIRGVGSTAAPITAADGIIRLANASPQAASYPAIRTTQPLGAFNLQQIIRTPWAGAKTTISEAIRGENDVVAFNKMKTGLQHAREIEQSCWFGARNQTTAATSNHGTQPQLMMGGFLSYITSNTTTVGGALSQSAFETWLKNQAFATGVPDDKLVVCSPNVAQALSGFALGKMAYPSPSISELGSRIMTYVSPTTGVNVKIVVHQDWRQYATGQSGTNFSSNANSPGGLAVCIDTRYCYLKGFRWTQFLDERQNPGDDAQVFELLTEATLVVKQQKNFALLRGVTG